jgi:hypothetical protein
MNPEIKEKWIAALESGEYKHTKKRLKKSDEGGNIIGYCCLGVLSDLYIKETGKANWNGDNKLICSDGNGSGSILPGAIQEWAGVDSHGNYNDDKESLTRLNDADTTEDFTPVIAVIKEHF